MERSKPDGGLNRVSIGPQRREEHKVTVSFVLIHRLLKHGFKDFIDSFNLAITLGVIGGGILMLKTQQRGELMPYLIFKMSAMVRDQLFWNPESSNDVVKEKEGCGGCHTVECWHILDPFCEIFNRHDDIFVVTRRWGSTLHKVDGPFTKGTS